MSFAEIRLEADFIIYGTAGGPTFLTDIVEVNSGFEQRNQVWSLGRGKWDFGERRLSGIELANIQGFFRARRGSFEGFRFKDWGDYQATHLQATKFSTIEQGLVGTGVGDGTPTLQLYKAYTSGSSTYRRQIRKPVSGTVQVYRNGELASVGEGEWQYTLDTTTGIVTWASPYPESSDVLTWSGEFDVPVRFDTDEFKAELIAGIPVGAGVLSETFYHLLSLPIIEIRV